MKRLICFFLGHKWDRTALENGYEYCERCRHDYPWYECAPSDTIPDWFLHHKYRLRNWLRSVKYKLQRKPPPDDVPF